MGWRYFGRGSDANDSFCPWQILYTGRVSEDAGPGLFILKISATDPDVGSNAQVTYSLHGPGAEEFRLGPHTGESRAAACFCPPPHPPREMQAPSMAQHLTSSLQLSQTRNGHSIEESELHTILFAVIANVVEMKGRCYC